MGRWMEKIDKGLAAEPTKPTEPGFVGFVGTPSPPFEKNEPEIRYLSPEEIGWVAAVASWLEVGNMYLLENKFIDQEDLEEQLKSDPKQAAALIKSDPRWYQRSINPPIPRSEWWKNPNDTRPTPETMEPPNGI